MVTPCSSSRATTWGAMARYPAIAGSTKKATPLRPRLSSSENADRSPATALLRHRREDRSGYRHGQQPVGQLKEDERVLVGGHAAGDPPRQDEGHPQSKHVRCDVPHHVGRHLEQASEPRVHQAVPRGEPQAHPPQVEEREEALDHHPCGGPQAQDQDAFGRNHRRGSLGSRGWRPQTTAGSRSPPGCSEPGRTSASRTSGGRSALRWRCRKARKRESAGRTAAEASCRAPAAPPGRRPRPRWCKAGRSPVRRPPSAGRPTAPAGASWLW